MRTAWSSPRLVWDRPITPAEPADEFKCLAGYLGDLLSISSIPDSHPLNEEWYDSVKEAICDISGESLRSVKHHRPDAELEAKIHKAKNLALQLAELLHHSPDLWPIPRRQWTVPREFQLYDDLADLQREFEALSRPEGEVLASGGSGKRMSANVGDGDKAKPLKSDPKAFPFGMTVDFETQTVKRFVAATEGTASIMISNVDQWDLFKLILKHNGKVAATEVRAKLSAKDERNRTVSRLRLTLQEIQLTFEYEKGKHYVLKEF